MELLIGLKIRILPDAKPYGWDDVLDEDQLPTLPYDQATYPVNDTYIDGNMLSLEIVGPTGRGWWYLPESLERV